MDIFYVLGTEGTSWIDTVDLTPLTTMAESVASKAGPIMVGILVISAGFALTKKFIKKASNG